MFSLHLKLTMKKLKSMGHSHLIICVDKHMGVGILLFITQGEGRQVTERSGVRQSACGRVCGRSRDLAVGWSLV